MKKKILIAIGAAIVVAIIAYVIVLLVTLSRLNNPALYEVEGMSAVVVKQDIEYKKVGDRSMKMDLYLPEHPTGNYPVMIFLQGTGPDFMMKNAKEWGMFNTYGRILAAKGYAAVVFNRRESMDYSKIEDSTEDINDLILHLKRNFSQYHLDMNQVGVWAFSGGGPYLSLFLRQPENVRCLISYYSILDLDLMRKNVSDDLPDTIIQDFSVTNNLSSSAERLEMLIVTAGKDRVKAIPTSNHQFVEKANDLGLSVRHLIHKDGRHGFDALDDNDRTREIIGETIEFIQSNL